MKSKNKWFVISMFLLVVCLNATVIGLRIPDTTASVGDIVNIPVYADTSVTGEDILSYQLQISFETDIIFANEIVIESSISESFGIPYFNNSIPGQITIAAAGTVPLSGIGVFLYIQFEILQNGFSLVSFTGEENNFFNEGTPGIIFENGSISNPASVSEFQTDMPHFVLSQNYPNPFRYSTTISFALNTENTENTKIVIYNLKGQLINQLRVMNYELGMNEIVWNGKDYNNNSVPSGIYFYQIQNSEVSASKIKKLILLK